MGDNNNPVCNRLFASHGLPAYDWCCPAIGAGDMNALNAVGATGMHPQFKCIV